MYYSGSVNNYTDLRAALFSACTAHGWSLSTDVLTKGTLAVKITVRTSSPSNAEGLGVIIQGGTAASGATLTNPSPNKARLGPPSYTDSQPTFPITYEIHLFENTDEVYLITNSNVDQHLWLAYGKSVVPGIGLWLSAISNLSYGAASNGINVSLSSASGGSQYSSGCIFWQPLQNAGGAEMYNQDTVHVNLDSILWAGNPASTSERAVGSVNAYHYAQNQVSVQPNAWNSDAVLMRIKPVMWRASNKCSIVADLQNARYIRMDNLNPGQIIQLGGEYWKCYPFYRKNVAARNGGSSIDHTGTFGWAIRYTGPL